eukprot:405629_1
MQQVKFLGTTTICLLIVNIAHAQPAPPPPAATFSELLPSKNSTYVNIKLPWDQANQFCMEYFTTRLLTAKLIDDETMEWAIESCYEGANNASESAVWIGLRRYTNWQWADSSSYGANSTNWYPGFPLNSGSDCSQLYTGSENRLNVPKQIRNVDPVYADCTDSFTFCCNPHPTAKWVGLPDVTSYVAETNQPTRIPTYMSPTVTPTVTPSTPSLTPSVAPTQPPTNAPSISPTIPPTMAPTPLCPSLLITIQDFVNFNQGNFNGLYTFMHNEINSRPIWAIPQVSTDKNIQYDGNHWVINGIGNEMLYTINHGQYPPIDNLNITWNHSTQPGLFHIDIQCVESFAPVSSPSNAPTIPPTASPTIPPTIIPTKNPNIYSTQQILIEANEYVKNDNNKKQFHINVFPAIPIEAIGLFICALLFIASIHNFSRKKQKKHIATSVKVFVLLTFLCNIIGIIFLMGLSIIFETTKIWNEQKFKTVIILYYILVISYSFGKLWLQSFFLLRLY